MIQIWGGLFIHSIHKIVFLYIDWVAIRIMQETDMFVCKLWSWATCMFHPLKGMLATFFNFSTWNKLRKIYSNSLVHLRFKCLPFCFFSLCNASLADVLNLGLDIIITLVWYERPHSLLWRVALKLSLSKKVDLWHK